MVNRILQRFFSITSKLVRNRFIPFIKEVAAIRTMAPVNLIVYYPKTKEGQIELTKRASEVHAAAVTRRIKALNCPVSQKLALLDAVIRTVKETSRERT